MLQKSQSIPSLKITQPTPIKGHCNASTTTSVPNENSTSGSSRSSNARLLYRGALSLPDSHLLLDGLTFTIDLISASHSSVDHVYTSHDALFETPLPLALESMRGRPSLLFLGRVNMDDIHCDFSERVNLHVHPRCTLTRQLFLNNLCESPVTASKGYTDYGIRIRLGDATTSTNSFQISKDTSSTTNNSVTNNNGGANSSDGSTDIVVFGRPHPSSSVMQLCVARILPSPSSEPPAVSLLQDVSSDHKSCAMTRENSKQQLKDKVIRPPRPDDPTPRKPPPGGFGGMARIGLGMKRARSSNTLNKDKEKERSTTSTAVDMRKRPRKWDSNNGPCASTTEIVGHDTSHGSGMFKGSPLPTHKASSSTSSLNDDVFGSGDHLAPVPSLFKSRSDQYPLLETNTVLDMNEASSSDTEAYNKLIIKKAAQKLMVAAGIGKNHASFKEFFSFVYRGTAFALRTRMNSTNLGLEEPESSELVDRIVQMHVTLYLGGKGVGVYLLQQ